MTLQALGQARNEGWRPIPRGVSQDAKLILAARALRAFADGFVSVLLPVYLLEVGFSVLHARGIAPRSCGRAGRREPSRRHTGDVLALRADRRARVPTLRLALASCRGAARSAACAAPAIAPHRLRPRSSVQHRFLWRLAWFSRRRCRWSRDRVHFNVTFSRGPAAPRPLMSASEDQ